MKCFPLFMYLYFDFAVSLNDPNSPNSKNKTKVMNERNQITIPFATNVINDKLFEIHCFANIEISPPKLIDCWVAHECCTNLPESVYYSIF